MIATKSEAAQKNLDQETFGSVLGQAVWLMTMSDAHRDLPIRSIEYSLATPIVLKQFKLYSEGQRPVAFLSWASVSDEVKVRFEAGDRTLKLSEWKSGKNVMVVDCVSPFMDRSLIIEKFREDVGSQCQ